MPNLHNSEPPSTTDAERLRLTGGGISSWRSKSLRAQLTPFGWAVLGIAIITWAGLRLGLNPLTGGFLYLIMVVVASAYG
ncbi:MAG: hypothetical protein WAO35_19775 [Terriglobia bacterium]